MTVFQISERFNKEFMNLLLREKNFDEFEVRGIEIHTITKFEISGAMDRPRNAEGEPIEGEYRNWCLWGELRPFVFNIIKAGKRPKILKIVLSLPSDKLDSVHTNASALFVNIVYENNELSCITATGQKAFSLDKTLDLSWDEYIKGFFADNGIVYVL